MPKEACGELALCAWRVADRLTASGRHYTAHDICLAIGDSGEPCGRHATTHFGAHENYGAEGEDWHRGQPFCDEHAADIRTDAFAQLKNHVRDIGLLEMLAEEERRALAAERSAESAAQSKKRHSQGSVYFARRGDRLKIGTSLDVPRRLRDLESMGGVSFDDVVITNGGRAKEQKYHRRFAEHRTKGEWFVAAPEILAEMDKLRPVA